MDIQQMAMSSSPASERSAVYRIFSEAFSYKGSQNGAFGISGADYNHAFDLAINPKACSLREARYTQEDHSSLFEELMRFYSFFGLSRGEKAEMPDHLSVELEFMHFLTHLESELEAGCEAWVSVRRAQADFMDRHVSRLVRGVHARLRSEAPDCVRLVNECRAFVEDELAGLEAGYDEEE